MLVAVIRNAHQVFIKLSCQQPSIFCYDLLEKDFKFWNNFVSQFFLPTKVIFILISAWGIRSLAAFAAIAT